MIASDGADLWRLRTPRLQIEVNGAGDLLSALFLYHWLDTRSAPESLARAASSVYGVVAATAAAGARELALIGRTRGIRAADASVSGRATLAGC